MFDPTTREIDAALARVEQDSVEQDSDPIARERMYWGERQRLMHEKWLRTQRQLEMVQRGAETLRGQVASLQAKVGTLEEELAEQKRWWRG